LSTPNLQCSLDKLRCVELATEESIVSKVVSINHFRQAYPKKLAKPILGKTNKTGIQYMASKLLKNKSTKAFFSLNT